MESNKLAILDSNLPLRAYPKGKLDEALNTQFKFWLANLLSIKADNEAKLDLAIPMIKDLFWSLGISEVKKAFEMYALGKLNLEPKSNYLDIVLVGQIFKEYKVQRVVPKKQLPAPTISDEEKQKLISIAFKKCIDYYEEKRNILDGYIIFLYDLFYDDGFLPTDKESKIKAYNDAKTILEMMTTEERVSLDQHYEIKEIRQELLKKKSPMVISKAKEITVLKFLRVTYRDENKIKELKLKYC